MESVRDGASPTAASYKGRVDVASKILRRGRAGLMLLLEAYESAHDAGRSIWDFAVEADVLKAAGLTNSDVRWLICKGYIEHGREITLPGDDRRSFRATGGLSLQRHTCCVLLDPGVSFVESAAGQPLANGAAAVSAATQNGDHAQQPKWDSDRQELRFGPVLIKQFKVPAPNQETILAAFEEEHWPPRIDDPLPPHPDQESKRRLHDTINSLNRNQKNPLIRFLGDGSGQGIRWEPTSRLNVGANGQA
jgi:hypothetical protein